MSEVFRLRGKDVTFRKKVLEYTFRNSAREELTTILLEEYSFILHKGRTKEVISYASIVAVRICKSANRRFKIWLTPDGHSPLVISSQSYTENGDLVDQWQGYSLFVRVLHHHLKDKSPAVFSSGGNMDRLGQWALFCAIGSFMISITADYVGFGLMNPYIQAVILAVLACMVLWIISANRVPKTYNPTEIPLQYLP
jgi:hypothetical protein